MHRLILAEEITRTARELGVALPIVEATTAEELDIAFATAAAQRADAIIVLGDRLHNFEAPRIVPLAAKHHLPAIYFFRQRANGGLIVYGPALTDLFRRASGYVDKILKGSLAPALQSNGLGPADAWVTATKYFTGKPSSPTGCCTAR